MADKVFTASGLKMEKLVFTIYGGDIYDSSGSAVVSVEQLYCYHDDQEDVINQLGRGSVVVRNDIGLLPANIQAALQELDTYMKAQALTKEGM
jgi:hypothetical protein